MFYLYQVSKRKVWAFNEVEKEKNLLFLNLLAKKYPFWITTRELYSLIDSKMKHRTVINSLANSLALRKLIDWKTRKVKDRFRPVTVLWRINMRNFDYFLQVIKYKDEISKKAG